MRRKLNAMPAVFAGKRVLLVDDSIVRGTTMSQIVDMVRRAGASKARPCASLPFSLTLHVERVMSCCPSRRSCTNSHKWPGNQLASEHHVAFQLGHVVLSDPRRSSILHSQRGLCGTAPGVSLVCVRQALRATCGAEASSAPCARFTWPAQARRCAMPTCTALTCPPAASLWRTTCPRRRSARCAPSNLAAFGHNSMQEFSKALRRVQLVV